jgi:hypothetical protein
MSENNQRNETTVILPNCIQPRYLPENITIPMLVADVIGLIGNGTTCVLFIYVYRTMMERLTEIHSIYAIGGLLLVDTLRCLADALYLTMKYFPDVYAVTLYIRDSIIGTLADAFHGSSNFIAVYLIFIRYIALCHPLKIQKYLRLNIFISVHLIAVILHIIILSVFLSFVSTEPCVTKGIQSVRVVANSKPHSFVTLQLSLYLLYHLFPGIAVVTLFSMLAKQLRKFHHNLNLMVDQIMLAHFIFAAKNLFLNSIPYSTLVIVYHMTNSENKVLHSIRSGVFFVLTLQSLNLLYHLAGNLSRSASISTSNEDIYPGEYFKMFLSD